MDRESTTCIELGLGPAKQPQPLGLGGSRPTTSNFKPDSLRLEGLILEPHKLKQFIPAISLHACFLSMPSNISFRIRYNV